MFAQLKLKSSLNSSVERRDVSDLLDVNMGYLTCNALCWGFGTWHTTFALAGNVSTTSIFEAKFGWSKDETILYNTLISTSAIIGLSLGSFLGASLLTLGRRKTALIANLMAIFGSFITMIGTTPFLCIGRLFLGLAAGTTNVVFGKMITETFPQKQAAKFAMCHNASICVGLIVAFGLGALLPDSENVQELKDDQLWRIIYLFPAFVGIVEIVLVLFVYKLEPIAYCIMTGKDDEGRAHMAKVYRKKDTEGSETIDEILAMQYTFMKRSTTMDASSTTFKAAVCGPKYAKGTWVCFFINMFNQQSGINAINVYANRLLKQMAEQSSEGDEFPFTVAQGTFIIGLSNAIGAILVFAYIGSVGRRPILITG